MLDEDGLSAADAFLSACLTVFLNEKLAAYAVKSSADIDALLATILCCRAGIGPFHCDLWPTMRIVTLCSWFSHLLFLASMLMELIGLKEHLPASCNLFQPLTAAFFLLATVGEDLSQGGRNPELNKGRELINAMFALPAVCKFRSACDSISFHSILPTVKTKLFSAAVNEVVEFRDKFSLFTNQKRQSERLQLSVAPSFSSPSKDNQIQCVPPSDACPAPKLPIS